MLLASCHGERVLCPAGRFVRASSEAVFGGVDEGPAVALNALRNDTPAINQQHSPEVQCRVPRLEESLPVINARSGALGAYLGAAIGGPVEGQHTARMKRL